MDGSPKEFLLVSAESDSPFSTSFVDPATGHAVWSHKGNELRGSAVRFAEPVGRAGDFLMVGSASQNLVSIMSPAKFQPLNCFVRSPVESCVVDSSGTFCVLALQNKLFSYVLRTGELIKISSGTTMRFNRIQLCPNDKFVIVFSNVDGAVFVLHMKDLFTRSVMGEETEPFRTLRAHKQPVADAAFGPLDSTRLLTVAADHQAVLWSLVTGQPLVRLSVDEALSAAALNATELTMFLGTEMGTLIAMDVHKARFEMAESDFLRASQEPAEESGLQICAKHAAPLGRIALSLDESRGASGDQAGVVHIWDAHNLQNLFRVQKAGPVRTLRFLPPFRSLTQPEHAVNPKAVKPLHREMTAHLNTTVLFQRASADEPEWRNKLDALNAWMSSTSQPQISNSAVASNAKTKESDETKKKQTDILFGAKSLSKSARRRLAKQKRERTMNGVAEPDEMEVDPEPDTTDSERRLQHAEAELEKLRKVNEKLIAENKKLFEFAKQQLDKE